MLDEAAVQSAKFDLRQQAFARRDALPAEERAAAAQAVATRPFPIPIPTGAIVSGYSPMKSEFNPVPLMPVVTGRGKPLIMRSWSFGAPLAAGVWGIRQPPPDAPEVFPDILLVPLAAFDRGGQRIGYGAGYYDMTISRLRGIKNVTAIGLAFAAQEVESVPHTNRDARLDLVLTEGDVIRCGA
jgi:5-formyltetrahydrofolate cyclo-ligase